MEMYKTKTILAHAMYQRMAVGDTKALFDKMTLEDLGMTPEEMEQFLIKWDNELRSVEGDYERAVQDVGEVIAGRLIIDGIKRGN